VSAQNRKGATKVVEFLVSEDPRADATNAILKIRELGEVSENRPPLPREFIPEERRMSDRPFQRSKTPGDASTEVRTKDGANRVTFLKGEAFEQLIGIALAFRYPEERIVPQYCLKVGVDSMGKGFYGMRADYLVGDSKIVEVKWGGATQNIVETYTRHTEQLLSKKESSQVSYQLIMLEGNPELEQRGLPHTLFSEFTAGLDTDTSYLLNETQARIAEMVLRGDGAQLERIRDYLYSALLEVRNEGGGARRKSKLQDALSALLPQNEPALRGIFEAGTTNYFNSLEANFEWRGKLHTVCIDPLQYYAEHPECYELLYTFDASYNNSFRRLYFAEQLARDLAVAQEILCGETQEFAGCNETIRNPVFSFGEGITVTAQSTEAALVAGEQIRVLTSLSELRELLKGTGLNSPDEWFGDQVGFAEMWAQQFPQRA
jgi:hypothetical protein